MEASETPEAQLPELDFELPSDWPEDVITEIRRLLGFDLDEVQGRERLGALAFNQAPAVVEEIRGIVRDLALEPWDEIPAPGDLQSNISELNRFLGEMLELSSDADNAAGEKQRLDERISEQKTWFRNQARPWARRAFIDQRLAERPDSAPEAEQLEEMRKTLGSLRKEADEVRRELESRRDLVNQFRDAARESAGQELSGVFLGRANDCRNAATRWLKALAVASVVAVIGAIVTFDKVRPDEGAHDPHDYAALGLGVFILGIFAFAVRVCAQNYRVNRHLEAVARSKAAAISTFQRLVTSAEDEEVKSAVTLTLAQAIFTTEETGLVDGSGDHVTLVERAIVPAVSRSTGGGGL